MQITDQNRIAEIDEKQAQVISDGHTMYFQQGRICVDTHIELKDDNNAYCIVTVYQFNEKEYDCTGFHNYSYASESFIRQEDYDKKDRFVFIVNKDDDMKHVYAKHAELNAEYSSLLNY